LTCTENGKQRTYQVEFDENWLADEDWNLHVYEVDQIAPGTTIVELQRLRVQITDEVVAQLTRTILVLLLASNPVPKNGGLDC
jgi:hypothetical protein